ncbi:MAG: DUF4037 domain-containing protein [Candidatus Thorarchaeota archaeon]
MDNVMPTEGNFIKGLDLSRIFYEEAVKPILETDFPDLQYSAARIGKGSDVLGFDTPQSMDHDWGLKLELFVSEADYEQYAERIASVLGQCLPFEVRGFPVNVGMHEDGTSVTQYSEKRPLNHGVKIVTVKDYIGNHLGINPLLDIGVVDWLVMPSQLLMGVVCGQIFHDELEELEKVRTKLSYYPRDIWLYILANQWRRLSQEIHFMGRCGQVDDELGSRMIASRLIKDLMGLCFLMEEQYAPYIKWFGSAFSQLSCSSDLNPIFLQALDGKNWEERQTHLISAYEYVAQMHNRLGITEPMEEKISPFHNRPFIIIQAEEYADAIYTQIQDDEVKSLPKWLGAVDQYSDSTDVLAYIDKLRKFRPMYG